MSSAHPTSRGTSCVRTDTRRVFRGEEGNGTSCAGNAITRAADAGASTEYTELSRKESPEPGAARRRFSLRGQSGVSFRCVGANVGTDEQGTKVLSLSLFL